MIAADTTPSVTVQGSPVDQSSTCLDVLKSSRNLDVSSSGLSPPADYLFWCVRVGADPLDVEALQEWDYLHADEMTEAEHRSATVWAVGLDLYRAA